MSLKPGRKKVISRYSFYILLLFYTVGLIGILSAESESFLQLSPFTLLLSLVLLFVCQKQAKGAFLLYFLLCWFIGFMVEVVGVKSGVLFGKYTYGSSLGSKCFDVPLIIGVNWFLLAIGAAYLSLRISNSRIFQVLTGAALMVLTDFFIEPVAPMLDYWYWENDAAPFQNYLAWFVVALLLQILFQFILKGKTNYLAASYYMVVTLFFIILRLLL